MQSNTIQTTSDKVEINVHGRIYNFQSTHEDEYILSRIRDHKTFYEYDLLDLLGHLQFPAGCFVDIGANIGNHSIFFAGEMNRDVVALEMDSQNFLLLNENIHSNNLTQNIRAFNCAISDHCGVVNFERNPQNCGATTITYSAAETGPSVQSLTLDDIFYNNAFKTSIPLALPVLIKIDVEGHELNVLQGAHNILKEKKPILVIETPTSYEFQRVVQFLDTYDYVPVAVGAYTDTYIFAHMKLSHQIANAATLYYSRRFEKISNRQSLTQMQVATEFNRVKNQLFSLYKTNNILKESLAKSQDRIAQLSLVSDAWERETSRLCGKIMDHCEKTKQFKLKRLMKRIGLSRVIDDQKLQKHGIAPEYITKIRKSIKADCQKQLKKATPVIQGLQSDFEKPLSYYRIALFAFAVSDDDILKAVHQLLGMGYGHIAIYCDKIDNIDIPRGIAVHSIKDNHSAFSELISQTPFTPTLILDLSTPLDLQKIIDVTKEGLKYTTSNDILLFDGIVRENESEQQAIVDMSATITDPTYVHAPLTMNMLIPKKFWFHTNGKKSLALKIAISASFEGLRLMIPPRKPIETEARTVDPKYIESIAENTNKFHINGLESTNSIAIIGRVDASRWHKGGIYYSCKKYGEICERLGIDAKLIEIDQPIEQILRKCSDTKAVFIYTGDQGAQDYFNVEPLLQALDDRGHSVVVNLSFDTHPERNQQIKETMQNLSDNCRLMIFTEDALDGSDLEDLIARTVVVPKTLRPIKRREISFNETKGVFLGDYGKFINPRITARAQETYEAIKEALPEAPLYFLRQYNTALPEPKWLDGYEILNYSDNIHDHFYNTRIFLHAQNYCTFEMLPVEAAMASVPVVYCDMPQSLNSYIGNYGMRYKTLETMQEALTSLYHNKDLWDRTSSHALGCTSINSLDNQDYMFFTAFNNIR